MKKIIVFALPAMCAYALRGDVIMTQALNLNRGWNAVYAEVSPTGTLDEAFAQWPVTKVGFYDPASFLATRQFGDGFETKGLSMNPVATWYRDYAEANDTERFPAGSVLLLFNTNTTATTVTLAGIPAAPRMTWHVTGTNDVWNFVGFSLKSGEKVLASDYFAGFSGGAVKAALYRVSGNYENKSPSFTATYSSRQIADGEVLLASSMTQSDWSGALFVSPMNGLDFGSDATKATYSVRNDGADVRTVEISLMNAGHVADGLSWGDVELPSESLHWRDADVALTNSAWNVATPSPTMPIASKTLAAGETWKIEFGLDRRKLSQHAKGKTFGLLLRAVDVDGGSKMRADVPLVGTTSGGTAATAAWPAGLWVADVALNRITPPGDTEKTQTGGTMKLRLPIHVDANGNVRLLQRVVAAGKTESDGTFDYRLYAGRANVPAMATTVMRVSAVCLPTETPVIAATSQDLSASGATATFEFTVAADGPTSLLRHPLHPQHDGLRWDFKTATPSGDDFMNYKGTVKPETFSVRNKIEIAIDTNGGEAAWNPEDAKGGTVKWTFSDLMRQGDIVLSGAMSIKRVSPKAEIVMSDE